MCSPIVELFTLNVCTSMYVSAYGFNLRIAQSPASTSAYRSTTASKPDTGKPFSSMLKKEDPSSFCARKSFNGFDVITFNSPGVGVQVCTYSPGALNAYVTFSSPKPGNFPEVETTFLLESNNVTVSLLPTLNLGLLMPSLSLQHRTKYAPPDRDVPAPNVNSVPTSFG